MAVLAEVIVTGRIVVVVATEFGLYVFEALFGRADRIVVKTGEPVEVRIVMFEVRKVTLLKLSS